MTVGELLSRMSNTELGYWMALQANNPLGEQRADLRAGIIAAEVRNANVSKRKDLRKPTDFMPFYKEPVEPEFDKVGFFKNLDKYAVRKT